MGNRSPQLCVQIASDLHIEYFDKVKEPNKVLFERLIEPKAPILALLGDIGCPGTDFGWKQFQLLLEVLVPKFEKILLIAGNHEFYTSGASFDKAPLTVPLIHARLQQLCDGHPKLEYLNNRSIELNGVRMVGTTLWSEIADNEAELVGKHMTDYKVSWIPYDDRDNHRDCGDGVVISETERLRQAQGVRKMTVLDTKEFHAEALCFIKKEATAAKLADQDMLVLTHHPPTLRNMSDKKADNKNTHDKVKSAFGTSLEYMFGYGKKSNPYSAIRCWVFGHTHFNWSTTIKGVRLACNQHGYMGRDNDASQLAKGFMQSHVVCM